MIAQVSKPLTVSTSDLTELKTQIAQLSATVAALQLLRSAGPSRRSFGRGRRRSRSRPRTTNLCWIDLAEMAAEQRRVGSPYDENVSGPKLQQLPLTTGNDTILRDISTPSHRPIVPLSLRRKAFSSLHNISLSGSRTTGKLVSDCFVWPAMHKDLKAWIGACIACQRIKAQWHKNAPIGTFPGSSLRLSHLHLGIVGPLPLSNVCSYLLTCVGRFTRWPEAIPLSDIAAPTVVKAFLSRWVAIIGATSQSRLTVVPSLSLSSSSISSPFYTVPTSGRQPIARLLTGWSSGFTAS
ncbi:hypothetical protein SprV_0100123100 [Sparganum proliferum]